MLITDKKLASYVSKYEAESQANPGRKIGDKPGDLDEILAAIARHSGPASGAGAGPADLA